MSQAPVLHGSPSSQTDQPEKTPCSAATALPLRPVVPAGQKPDNSPQAVQIDQTGRANPAAPPAASSAHAGSAERAGRASQAGQSGGAGRSVYGSGSLNSAHSGGGNLRRFNLGVRLGCLIGLLVLVSAVGSIMPIFYAGDEVSALTYGRMLVMALICPVLAMLLGAALWRCVWRGVVDPVRRLLQPRADNSPSDEMDALTAQVEDLREFVARARTELDVSQNELRRAEKLALVGKLAAGMAHSIRNPLTSVKLRLFSLEQGLDLSGEQREDFQAIGEALRQIEGSTSNFLEFARRPRLSMRAISPSDIVDSTLRLLRPRLETLGVEPRLEREGRLAEVEADPEQLQEAMANIIINACEAMGEASTAAPRLDITESQGIVNPIGAAVVIKIADNGPGIAPGMKDEIFTPFFSTKEEGTGLGLPIAKEILEEHEGWLHMTSVQGKNPDSHSGTTFVLVLPVKEEAAWLRA